MQYLIGLFIGIGLYMILADYFRVPYFATSKAHNNLAHRQEKKISSLDIWLGDLAVWLSRHIKLNEYKKIQLQTDLRSAGITLSPEMHIANAIVKSVLIGAMAIPVAFIFPLLCPVILILAFLIYLKSSKGVADKIKAKRKKIEYELPRFVSHIEKTLKHNRDVLYILDGYMKNAGKEMGDELEITVAELMDGEAAREKSVRAYDDEQIMELLKRTQELEKQKNLLFGVLLFVMGMASQALSNSLGGSGVKDFFSGILLALSVAEMIAGIFIAGKMLVRR